MVFLYQISNNSFRDFTDEGFVSISCFGCNRKQIDSPFSNFVHLLLIYSRAKTGNPNLKDKVH